MRIAADCTAVADQSTMQATIPLDGQRAANLDTVCLECVWGGRPWSTGYGFDEFDADWKYDEQAVDSNDEGHKQIVDLH